MTANKYRGTIKLSNHYFGGGGGLVTQTLWTVACQARLSMGFSRQEYWSGLPITSPGDLPYTHESNMGLLHCRRILYQLSYEGSPNHYFAALK